MQTSHQIQSSGLDLRDLFHRESEVYKYIPKVSPTVLQAFTDPYLLYLHLINVFNISIPDDTLDKRVKTFFMLYGAPIVNFNSFDKIKLLIFGERYKKVFPIGRPWERIEGEKAEERFLPTSDYIKKYVDKTYERLMLSKQAFEIRTQKPERRQEPFFPHILKLINLQSQFWIQKFDDNINREVEVRFLNISGTEFSNLFDFFINAPQFYFNNIVSHINILNDDVRETRFIESPLIAKPFLEKKRVLGQFYKNKQWEFKVVTSEEIIIPNYTGSVIFNNKRLKNSFKFYTPDKKSPFYNMEISLSIVIESLPGKQPLRKYEVEIERKFGNEKYWRNRINKNVQSIEETVGRIIKIGQTNAPIDFFEKQSIKDYLNSISNKKDYFNPVSQIANKVLPFTKTRVLDFLSFDYLISPKLDGDRKLLFVKSNLGSFLLGLDGSIIRIGPLFRIENRDITLLLDCEIKDKKIHIFDVIVDSKSSVISSKVFTVRQTCLPNLKNWINDRTNLYKGYSVVVKTFSELNKLNDVIPMVEFVFKNCNYDGIIFQSNTPYFQSKIFKWKPHYMNTIDFLLSSDNIPVTLSQVPIKNVAIKINQELLPYRQQFSYTNFILECFYNPLTLSFTPFKVRFDKTGPNNLLVVEDTKKLITDPFTKENFRGYQLILARKVINELKRRLLKLYSGTLLDIGSGQGGDIDKWNKFEKIIAVEPDDKKIQEFRDRLAKYPDVKSKVILVQQFFDETTYRKIIKENYPDLITFFFSVNYVFQSKKTLKNLLITLNSITKVKPSPILLLVHDSKILLKEVKPCKDIVKISLMGTNKISVSIVGTKHVVGVEEYIFDTERFIIEASQYFHVSVTTIADVMTDLKLKNLSEIESLWLKSIKLLTLTKYAKPQEQIYISEEKDIEEEDYNEEEDEVEIDYATEELKDVEEEIVEEEEDIIIIEEEATPSPKQDFPSDILVFSQSKTRSLKEVNMKYRKTFDRYKDSYESCIATLHQEYKPYIWNVTKYTYVLLECLLKYKVDVNVSSNQKPTTFIVENLLPYSITYDTIGNKTIENLLFKGFTKTSSFFVEGKDRIIHLKELPITEEFLENLVNTNLRIYIPISYACIIFVVDTSEDVNIISVEDIKNSMLIVLESYEKLDMTNCGPIFKQRIVQKRTEKLVLAPPENGIVWKANSCYADSVLMCMGASNMVKIYLELLSKSDYPIAIALHSVLERIYRNHIGTLAEEIIREVGMKCGKMADSSEFYRKICEKVDNVLSIKIRKKNVEETACVIFKSDLDEKNITSFQAGARFFVVENDTDSSLMTLIGKPPTVASEEKKIKEDHFKKYVLQGCIYVLPGHYICSFRRYNKWYLYDGIKKSNIKVIKSFQLQDYEGKTPIPYLLFYSNINL